VHIKKYFPLRGYLWLGLVTAAQSSLGQEALTTQVALEGQETVQREFHPAGPTTIREWRVNSVEQPYRIAFERIRSGHLLVGKARLQRQYNGTWFVVLSSGTRVRLLGSKETKTKTLVTFAEDKRIWKVRVTNQELPVDRPGIATEAEPSLDMIIESGNREE